MDGGIGSDHSYQAFLSNVTHLYLSTQIIYVTCYLYKLSHHQHRGTKPGKVYSSLFVLGCLLADV